VRYLDTSTRSQFKPFDNTRNLLDSGHRLAIIGELAMPDLKAQVLEDFTHRLQDEVEIPDNLCEQLTELLDGAQLPKADTLIKLISDHSGEPTA
jgi:hypothetical protein